MLHIHYQRMHAPGCIWSFIGVVTFDDPHRTCSYRIPSDIDCKPCPSPFQRYAFFEVIVVASVCSYHTIPCLQSISITCSGCAYTSLAAAALAPVALLKFSFRNPQSLQLVYSTAVSVDVAQGSFSEEADLFSRNASPESFLCACSGLQWLLALFGLVGSFIFWFLFFFDLCRCCFTVIHCYFRYQALLHEFVATFINLFSELLPEKVLSSISQPITGVLCREPSFLWAFSQYHLAGFAVLAHYHSGSVLRCFHGPWVLAVSNSSGGGVGSGGTQGLYGDPCCILQKQRQLSRLPVALLHMLGCVLWAVIICFNCGAAIWPAWH